MRQEKKEKLEGGEVRLRFEQAEVRGSGGVGGRGKSGKKVDKNGDFSCFFGWAVVEGVVRISYCVLRGREE